MSRLLEVALDLVIDGRPLQVTAAAERTPSRPGPLSAVAEKAESVVAFSAARADDSTLILTLRIEPPWHIQANPPGERLIATRVRLPARLASDVVAIEYPAGELVRFDFAEDAVPAYRGEVSIVVRFKPGVNLSGARVALEYQACDHSSCLPPVTKEAPVP
jgi:DsbC/DsbD-like thiol-disulfide interchange protein